MKNSEAKATSTQSSGGRIYYSNMIGKAAPGIIGKSIYLYQPEDSYNRLYIVANSKETERGRVVIFNAAGELITSQVIDLFQGKNTIELSGSLSMDPNPRLIAVYVQEQLAFMQKLS